MAKLTRDEMHYIAIGETATERERRRFQIRLGRELAAKPSTWVLEEDDEDEEA